MIQISLVETVDGPMTATTTDRGLAALRRGSDLGAAVDGARRRFPGEEVAIADSAPRLVEALRAYRAGRSRELPVAVDLGGLPTWDRRVLEAVRRIPYGMTSTYGEVARAIGAPGAARAVGGALARCPIAMVIPCHRVVRAADGRSGWSGDVAEKWRLLRLEGALRP